MPLDAPDREMLETLQRDTFDYFLRHADPSTGLTADRTEPSSHASITATGLALTSYCVAAERGWLQRNEAIAKTLTTLRFFTRSVQGPQSDASGYHGFYYHFLEMSSGRRGSGCELSTIDTTFLIAGALTAGSYFSGHHDGEQEIRDLADTLYRRVDWAWATTAEGLVRHGWTPEGGFLSSGWYQGYSEALLLYVLALGSPTFPIGPDGYRRWTATFERKTLYGFDHLYAGPLFIHQLPQIWLDLRTALDDRNRELGCSYFENSRRATLMQHDYAVDNPGKFVNYSTNSWGLTACNGPGDDVRVIDGVQRQFYGYLARGAPFGPDDGTIAPWAVVASLPFAPERVCTTIRHAVERLAPNRQHRGGFAASYNSTYLGKDRPNHWVSPWRLGLNEGPIVLMIENLFSELVWRTFMRSPYVATGLQRAGFR